MPVSPTFNFEPSGKDLFGFDLFTLNTNLLDNDRIYFIFHEGRSSTFDMIDYLRSITFLGHNEGYSLEMQEIENIKVYAFSIPKVYLETCRRIATICKLTLSHIYQSAIMNKRHVLIPSSPRIFAVRPKNGREKRMPEAERMRILGFGVSLANNDLD